MQRGGGLKTALAGWLGLVGLAGWLAGWIYAAKMRIKTGFN